jgi:3'-phosphoadenosine 5'-phosphosulfate sulfotransferase (PAPS reductase)/FAD synthetase
MDNEFLLNDRLQKIQQIIGKYGEGNFYISYSGGMDSNVLSALIDMALPDNKIPRVYADTGIELNAVRDFVREKAAADERFVIIKPRTPIKTMLEEVGYPFKSKFHSLMVDIYQRNGETKSIMKYLRRDPTVTTYFSSHCCPKKLTYQFSDDFKLKISAKCCDELKKKPLDEYQKQNNKPYKILGIMPDEGGNVRQRNVLLSAAKS